MAVQLVAVVPVIAGFIGWVNSLPSWVKYFIFLIGLAGDAGFTGGITGGKGIIGSILSYSASFVFHVPNFPAPTSWQLMIIAAFLPIVFYCLESQSN